MKLSSLHSVTNSIRVIQMRTLEFEITKQFGTNFVHIVPNNVQMLILLLRRRQSLHHSAIILFNKRKHLWKNRGVELSKNWSQIWPEELEKNYISLDILPETTRVEIYSQTASIGPVDLLSNVGGQTGLWIGLSFLSLVEIIEMIFRLLRYHIIIVQNKVFPRSPCVNANEPNSF